MEREAEDSEDISALKLEYENSKAHIDTQRETMHKFSIEAQKISRLILILLGIAIIGVVSFGPVRFAEFVDFSNLVLSNPAAVTIWQSTMFVFLLLALTFLLHAIGTAYEAIGLASYGLARDIDSLLENDLPNQEKYLRDRLDTYKDRIEENDQTILVFDLILGLGKFSMLGAIFAGALIVWSLVYGTIDSFHFLMFMIIVLSLLGAFWWTLPSSYNKPGI